MSLLINAMGVPTGTDGGILTVDGLSACLLYTSHAADALTRSGLRGSSITNHHIITISALIHRFVIPTSVSLT